MGCEGGSSFQAQRVCGRGTQAQGGREGVLPISSDGDGQRIFLGMKFSIPRLFGWANLASIFLGGLI